MALLYVRTIRLSTVPSVIYILSSGIISCIYVRTYTCSKQTSSCVHVREPRHALYNYLLCLYCNVLNVFRKLAHTLGYWKDGIPKNNYWERKPSWMDVGLKYVKWSGGWCSTEHCVSTDYILYASMYSTHACPTDSVNSDALHNSILVATQQCNECQWGDYVCMVNFPDPWS